MPILLADVLLFAWVCWLAAALGSSLVPRVLVDIEGEHRKRCGLALVWLSATAGFALLTAVVFIMGIPHWFSARAVYALLGGLTLLGAYRTWQFVSSCWPAGRHSVHSSGGDLNVPSTQPTPYQSTRSETWAGVLLTAALAPVLLAALGGALTPEVRGDAIIYHITEANLYVLHKGHVEIASSALTYIPQGQQMLYALALLLSSDVLAKLLHYAAGLLLLAGTGALALRLGATKLEALAAATLLALFPIWIYLATTTMIDLATANYTLAGVYVLLPLFAARDANDRLYNTAPRKSGGEFAGVIFSGVMLGFACGTKYTALVTSLAPVLAVLGYQVLRRRWSANVKPGSALVQTICLGAVALAVFSPWLIRNTIWTCNPLTPSFMRQLGPPGVPESTLNWPDIQAGDPGLFLRPLELLQAYVSMFLQFSDYLNFLPLFALILGSLGLAAPPDVRAAFFPPVVRMLLLFCLITFLAGVPLAAVRRDSRYVMAQMAIVAVLVVLWSRYAMALIPANRHRAMKAFSAVVLVALFVSWAAATHVRFADLKESLIPTFSDHSRHAYARARLVDYDANRALAAVLPPGWQARILGAAYPARVPYVLGGATIDPEYIHLDRTKLLPSDLPRLKKLNISHVLGEVTPEMRTRARLVADVHGLPLYELLF